MDRGKSEAHWSPSRRPWWFHRDQVSGTMFIASREGECTAPFSRVHLTGERAICGLYPDERLCPHYDCIIHKRDTMFRNLPPFQTRYIEATWSLPKLQHNCLPHIHEIQFLKGNVYFVCRKACFYNWICRDAETMGDRKYSLHWMSQCRCHGASDHLLINPTKRGTQRNPVFSEGPVPPYSFQLCTEWHFGWRYHGSMAHESHNAGFCPEFFYWFVSVSKSPGSSALTKQSPWTEDMAVADGKRGLR